MKTRDRAAIVLVVVFVGVALLGFEKAYGDARPGDTGQEVVEVQYLLRSHGYVLAVDGRYGAQTAKAVRHFQKSSGLLPDSIAGPITMAALGGAPATRVPAGPPPGSSPCQRMDWWIDHVGLPDDFHRIGRRESGPLCDNAAANACCFGWFQNFFTSHMRSPGYLPGIRACGIDSLDDVWGANPRAEAGQACMTKALYDVSGLRPWRL